MPDEHPENAGLSEGDFMRLFLQHETALRAFARTILPDWNAVDDALQEASVTMWQKLPQLENEEGFLPWAKVILRFKCLSAVSARRRDQALLSDRVLEQLAEEAEALAGEDIVAMRRALASCLSEFSQAHQELLLAPYIGGGRVREFAEMCGKSVNALYKLLGRLREKLGACMRKQLRVEEG